MFFKFFTGQYELAEDALASEISSIGAKEETVSKVVETRRTNSSVADADLTEPTTPVVVKNIESKATPPSPSKADKILALISEIGANQVKKC